MELIVYFDDQYPTVWIPRNVSEEIATFLKGKDFIVHNAECLAKWMQKSIDEKSCWQSVVVFSQDVVPNTVCHTASPSALIREYLDCGGTVVWIGDIPFFYFGVRRCKKTKYYDARLIPLNTESGDHFEGVSFAKPSIRAYKDRNGNIAVRWGSGGCFSILDVMPLYLDFPSDKVKFTKEGKSFKLKNQWYSIRPILIKGLNLGKKRTKILAKTDALSLRSTQKTIFGARVRSLNEVKESETLFSSLIGDALKYISIIIPALTAVVSFVDITRFTSILPYEISISIAIPSSILTILLVLWFIPLKERYASAWFKNFNEEYPESGFIRLWDFRLCEITEPMLEELCNVALRGFEKGPSTKE